MLRNERRTLMKKNKEESHIITIDAVITMNEICTDDRHLIFRTFDRRLNILLSKPIYPLYYAQVKTSANSKDWSIHGKYLF